MKKLILLFLITICANIALSQKWWNTTNPTVPTDSIGAHRIELDSLHDEAVELRSLIGTGGLDTTSLSNRINTKVTRADSASIFVTPTDTLNQWAPKGAGTDTTNRWNPKGLPFDTTNRWNPKGTSGGSMTQAQILDSLHHDSDAGHFLDGSGAWSTPAGGGDVTTTDLTDTMDAHRISEASIYATLTQNGAKMDSTRVNDLLALKLTTSTVGTMAYADSVYIKSLIALKLTASSVGTMAYADSVYIKSLISAKQTAHANLTSWSSPTAYRFLYSNGTSTVSELNFGADSYVLKSNGLTTVPSWSPSDTVGLGVAQYNQNKALQDTASNIRSAVAPRASPTFTGTVTTGLGAGTVRSSAGGVLSSTASDSAGLGVALYGKAPVASPTFTGTVTLPVGLTGTVRVSSGVVSATASDSVGLGVNLYNKAPRQATLDSIAALRGSKIDTSQASRFAYNQTKGQWYYLYRGSNDSIYSVYLDTTFFITKWDTAGMGGGGGSVDTSAGHIATQTMMALRLLTSSVKQGAYFSDTTKVDSLRNKTLLTYDTTNAYQASLVPTHYKVYPKTTTSVGIMLDSTGAGGSGETNTASNKLPSGSTAVGVWIDKNTYDLRFKGIYGKTGILVTNATDSIGIAPDTTVMMTANDTIAFRAQLLKNADSTSNRTFSDLKYQTIANAALKSDTANQIRKYTVLMQAGVGSDSVCVTTAYKIPMGISTGFTVDSVMIIQMRTGGSLPSVRYRVNFGTDISAAGTLVDTTTATSYTTVTAQGGANINGTAAIPPGAIVWLDFPTVTVAPKTFLVVLLGHRSP